MIPFNNTYSRLPASFYQRLSEGNSFIPSLIAFNLELAQNLGLDRSHQNDQELAEIFSAVKFMDGSEPLAMAYAGHQFGHFVPSLGDGRAMLLGEFLAPNNTRFDVHLKGSGRTAFSRRGDGNSALGPVLREFIVSEAMHALGIPTTRSLCAVRTGEEVYRDESKPGAVLTRVALSHIRVGTFEYFARKGDLEGLKILADYSINKLYPEQAASPDAYFEFWKAVCGRQMKLVAQWMSVGFIHGVMNTDNMNISGETIDYGPCAFMDQFESNKVFSSIDQNGRYAFSNQPKMAIWNLCRFAECLIPLMGEDGNAQLNRLSTEVEKLYDAFMEEYMQLMSRKLGFVTSQAEDHEIVRSWLGFLEKHGLDYTLSFVGLGRHLLGEVGSIQLSTIEGFSDFSNIWRKRLAVEQRTPQEIVEQMKAINPTIIPRNHQVERVIKASELGDDKLFFDLLAAVKSPYSDSDSDVLTEYQRPPELSERVTQTFCGT